MHTPHPMQQYHDLLHDIQTQGTLKGNRTGERARFLPNRVLTFDLSDGFPAITTKRLAVRAAIGELIGFFRGYQNASAFTAIGCKVWEQNANETPSWLASPFRKGTHDLGRVYGSQFTDWHDWREAHSAEDAAQLEAAGYTLLAHDATRGVWVLRRGINQLERCLHTLLTDPTDRRMVVSAWRPDEFDQMCLPPCHMSYTLSCDTEKRELHLMVNMRSFDSFLAFNITIGALWLSIYAKMAGYTPRSMMLTVADAHVYENHTKQVALLLSRSHFAQPELLLGDSIPVIKDLSEVPGVFARIQPEDIQLMGYTHHPAIPAPMSA